MDFRKTIGENLKALRYKNKYKFERIWKLSGKVYSKISERPVSGADVGVELGMHVNTIYYLEKGQREMTFDQLFKLCKYFKVTPNDLLKGCF